MNKCFIINKVMSTLKSTLHVLIYLYVLYVLYNPGTYFIFCAAVLFGALSIWLHRKLRKYLKRTDMDEVSIIEDKFASTYRRRYYNKYYVVAIILSLIISMSVLGSMVKEQLDPELNMEYIKSVQYLYDEMDLTSTGVITKACILIPSETKKAINLTVDTIRKTYGLIQDIYDIQEKGELVTEEYVKSKAEQITSVSDNINYKTKTGTTVLIIYLLLIQVVRLLYDEVLNITEHYSIKL